MGEIKQCSKCKDYATQIKLLEGKLVDTKQIYDDSIKTYRKALTDREYELIIRECEVVKEIEGLKSVISKLTKELNALGVKVEIKDSDVVIKNQLGEEKVKKTVKEELIKDVKTDIECDSKKVKKTVKKELIKESVKNKSEEKVKEKVNTKVKETVKKELNKGLDKSDECKNSKKGNVLNIVLPEIDTLTDFEKEVLYKRGKKIIEAIDSNIKDDVNGVPQRRTMLYKKHPEFFASMVLLLETTPKSRDSYSWSTVTNMLRECEAYKGLVSEFTKDTQFKLTYLNIRNWYLHLMSLIGNIINN